MLCDPFEDGLYKQKLTVLCENVSIPRACNILGDGLQRKQTLVLTQCTFYHVELWTMA